MTQYTYEDANDQIGQIAGEIAAMQRKIGHKIPHPASQAMSEQLTMWADRPQAERMELYDMALRLYARAL